MSFKIGDKILLRATITDINKDAIYPYVIDIELGEHNWRTNDFACDSSAIVSVYRELSDNVSNSSKGNFSEGCSCFHEEYGKQVCYGTKEREECDCGGDPMKCNFYDEVRKREKEHIYTIAEPTDEGTVVTADLYRATLRDIQNMFYVDILQMMSWLEYETPLNKEACLKRIIENYTPKEVVDRFEKFKYDNVVHVGDVIYLESDKREYLVTKIENGSYSMIAKDGYTTNVTYQNHLNTIPRNAYKKIKGNESIKTYLEV